MHLCSGFQTPRDVPQSLTTFLTQSHTLAWRPYLICAHTSPVTRLEKSLPTISQPEHFQHSDKHVPQIALTLSQLAGGNLPQMSSAVMSWLNGVGEMATYVMSVWHAAAREAVHSVPRPKKVSGKCCVVGLTTCCFYISVLTSTLSPGVASIWSLTHCTRVLHCLFPSVYYYYHKQVN